MSELFMVADSIMAQFRNEKIAQIPCANVEVGAKRAMRTISVQKEPTVHKTAMTHLTRTGNAIKARAIRSWARLSDIRH